MFDVIQKERLCFLYNRIDLKLYEAFFQKSGISLLYQSKTSIFYLVKESFAGYVFCGMKGEII